jgi:transposase InsO family protein
MRRRALRLGPKGQTIQRKKPLKGRKPKGYKASAPGQCGAFDTVEYFLDGIRRYVITFTDHYSRFAFAWATQSHASLAAREFFEIVAEVFPYPLQSVLTDNGSELMKHFDEELRRLHKNHWHTYPKTPKMNARVERFNRTISGRVYRLSSGSLARPRSVQSSIDSLAPLVQRRTTSLGFETRFTGPVSRHVFHLSDIMSRARICANLEPSGEDKIVWSKESVRETLVAIYFP